MTEHRPDLHAVSTELQALRAEVAELRSASQRSRRRWLGGLTAAALVLAGVGLTAGAQTVSDTLIPFMPDEPARASDVNFNFNLLRVWLEQKAGTVGSSTVTMAGPLTVTNLTTLSGGISIPPTAPVLIGGAVTSKALMLQADGEVQVHTILGQGTDATVRFQSVISTVGTAISRTTSSTVGDMFTVNETGLYVVTASLNGAWNACPTHSVVVAKNTVSAAPAWNDVKALAALSHYDSVSYDRFTVTNLVNLAQGDVVRVFAAPACSDLRFEIKRVR